MSAQVQLLACAADDAALSRLDSSIKKNAAFIKRLRQAGEDSRRALLDDINRLNLSKYVSEAVAAVAESGPRPADMPAVVEVASALHQRYAEFGAAMGPALAKAFGTSTKGGERSQECTCSKLWCVASRVMPGRNSGTSSSCERFLSHVHLLKPAGMCLTVPPLPHCCWSCWASCQRRSA